MDEAKKPVAKEDLDPCGATDGCNNYAILSLRVSTTKGYYHIHVCPDHIPLAKQFIDNMSEYIISPEDA
jgi:hypothetical protein